MRARLANEGGSTLIVAIILIGVMMGIGLATAAYVDGEQAQSGRERVRESAFNIAESALDAQVLQMSQTWPSASAAYPVSCTPSSASNLPCPDAASLQASATSADYSTAACQTGSAAPLWTTSVHDDGGGTTDYYDAAVVNAQPTYDANANGKLWVRASGTARCKQRSVITMVNQGTVSLQFPRNVVTANWFRTTNNGKKTIVDTKGSSPQAAGLVVRCAGISPPHTPPSNCMGYDPSKGQVTPDTSTVSPTTPATTTPATTISSVDLAALKARAITLNTYYATGCPASLTGPAVYVEDFSGCSGGAGNSDAVPGTLYIGRGTFSIGGNSVFYGLIYMGNLQGSTGAVVSLGGTSLIKGSVAVDGQGGVSAGSSKANIIFDDRFLDAFKGSGTVSRTPNSWRELPFGQ